MHNKGEVVASYTYNSNGDIVRSIDIMAEREYNYIYNKGKLIEAITYSIKLSGDNIVEKTSTDNIRYIYDSDGNMTKKIITAGDDASFISCCYSMMLWG